MSEANIDLSFIPDHMDELEIQLEQDVRLLKAKNRRRTLKKHHSRSRDFDYDGNGKRLKKYSRCRSAKRSRSTAVG